MMIFLQPSILIIAIQLTVMLVVDCNNVFVSAAKKSSKRAKVNVYDGPTKCDEETLVEKGNFVAIHYTGSIDESSKTGEKGSEFDSSRTSGFAFGFMQGREKVVKGLDDGVVGLCKGSSATIIIPPDLAFMDKGSPDGKVPGGATVKFDVEIVDVKKEEVDLPQPPKPNEFAKIDSNMDGKLSREEAVAYFESQEKQVDYDSLWRAEDTDKDGYISWEEFTGPKGDGPPSKEQQAQQEQQQMVQVMQQSFQLMDKNQDKKLTKDEVRDFFKRNGREVPKGFWKHADVDNNKVITWQEFVQSWSYLTGQQQAEQQRDLGSMANAFRDFDRNDDGKLTKDEVESFFKANGREMSPGLWEGSDKDKNGYVTWEEFSGSKEPIPPPGAAGQQQQQRQEPDVNDMADNFRQMDTDGDKMLTKDEVEYFFKSNGQDMVEGMFEAGDTNSDGYITWDEFSGSEKPIPPPRRRRVKDEL